MMLGIEDYGSGSDSESEPTPSTSKSILASKLPPPAKKSSIALPPPKTNSGGLSLPPPKTKRGPKKITIGLPTLPGDSKDGASDEDERPAAKKPRLDSGKGAGASALLSMLPAPKQKGPAVAPPPERVLGGGKGPGLVFNTTRPSITHTSPAVNENEEESEPAPISSNGDQEDTAPKTSSVSFLPPSLKKGRTNISLEEGKAPPRPTAAPKVSAAPAVDFFSLGNAASSSRTPAIPKAAPPIPSSSSTPSASTSSLQFSSAPQVAEFKPPDPTAEDPYPGYYLLPSGSWAAYDEAYYKKFYDKWTKQYNDHVRALEKGSIKGFEGYDTSGPSQEVDMSKEMERAKVEIKEREEKKALTGGAAKEGELAEPKMNIKGAKMGKMARSRGQLTTLLSEAYQNREALEERIAQGRRNRKEAGNKYGF